MLPPTQHVPAMLKFATHTTRTRYDDVAARVESDALRVVEQRGEGGAAIAAVAACATRARHGRHHTAGGDEAHTGVALLDCCEGKEQGEYGWDVRPQEDTTRDQVHTGVALLDCGGGKGTRGTRVGTRGGEG